MMACEKSKLARWENYIDLGAEGELETRRDAIQERVRRAAGEALQALHQRSRRRAKRHGQEEKTNDEG
jgi:hypothetical protein